MTDVKDEKKKITITREDGTTEVIEDRRSGKDRRKARRRRGQAPFDARIWGFEDRRTGLDRRTGHDRRRSEQEKPKAWLDKPTERAPMDWKSDSEW